MRVLSCEEGAIEWESNSEIFPPCGVYIMYIPLCWAVCSCGYWSRACISHFDDQKSAFPGGVKCEKSAVERS